MALETQASDGRPRSRPLGLRRRTRRVVSGVAVLALALSACTADPEEAGDDETERAAVEGTGETTTLRVGIPSDLSTLDLGNYQSGVDNRALVSVYDSLTTRAADGSVIPWLAHDWDVSDDFRTWTFHLEEGVIFHNGEEMTADDVAFSLQRYADPDYPGGIGGTYADVEEISVVDDYTVEVVLEGPAPRFYNDVAFFHSPIVPRSVAEGLDYEDYASSPETAIGTGGYRVVEWAPDQHLRLEAHDEFWRGKPAIDELVLIPIPEDTSRTSALLAGDIDVAQAFPLEQGSAFDGTNYELRTATTPMRVALRYATDEGRVFDDIRLRQAISHAIDKEAITESLFEGHAVPITGFCLPQEIGYNPDLEDPYPYDPERARELIAEAGAEGLELDFAVRTGSLFTSEVGDIIAAMVDEVGITLNTRVVDSADFVTGSSNLEYDIAFNTQPGGGQFRCDSPIRTWYHPRGNPNFYGFWTSDELEDLYDQAMLVPDDEGAIELIQEIDQLMLDDAAHLPLYSEPAFWGVHKDLDWEPHGTDALYFADAAWR